MTATRMVEPLMVTSDCFTPCNPRTDSNSTCSKLWPVTKK